MVARGPFHALGTHVDLRVAADRWDTLLVEVCRQPGQLQQVVLGCTHVAANQILLL
jgi:hypothetical protein